MNILGCSDEFFNIFLNMEVFWITFTLALLNNIVPGKMGINYYICTGEDPEFYQALGSKVLMIPTPIHVGNLMAFITLSVSGSCGFFASSFFINDNCIHFLQDLFHPQKN